MNDIHKWIRSKYRSTNGHKPCVLNMNDRTHQTNRSFVHNQRTYRTFKIWPTSDVGVGLLHEIELHFLHRCTQSIIAVMHSSCVLFVCLRYICISDCLLNREPSCFPIHFFFIRTIGRTALPILLCCCCWLWHGYRNGTTFRFVFHMHAWAMNNEIQSCRWLSNDTTAATATLAALPPCTHASTHTRIHRHTEPLSHFQTVINVGQTVKIATNNNHK